MINSLLSFFFSFQMLTFVQSDSSCDGWTVFQPITSHHLRSGGGYFVVFLNSLCIYVLMSVGWARKPKARASVSAPQLKRFKPPAAELLGCTETLQSVASWKMDESLLRIRHFFSPRNTMWQWFLRRSERTAWWMWISQWANQGKSK